MSVQDKELANVYEKKSDRMHILDTPDTYIGSIEEDTILNWTYNDVLDKMIYKEFKWIPGLYKCFDEGIVNARDHYIRMEEKVEENKKSNIPVKNIEVFIDRIKGSITIFNDGNGIDIAKHPEYDIWIPEMIFGHLRTSTNYNKNQKRIVGGKNGFGFKLVLIYSLWGKIETVDHIRGLKYTQEFKENLSIIEKPKITKYKGKPYTKISWLPDYKRFGISGLNDDMFSLLKKRTYDISAITSKNVKVKFNSNIIPVKTFEHYVNLYIGEKSESKRVYEKANERWEYAVSLTPVEEFTQVSFVNGIYTNRGGKHIEYILNQIVRGIVAHIETKKKVKVSASSIKEQLMLFVNCVIENPAFDSQTKDYMNTPVAKFGSSCKVSETFIQKVAKLGVLERAINISNVRNNKLAKKTDGKKTKNVKGVHKLIDANYAGTTKSGDCTLILCEGDSAKAGIVSGLSKEDRNYIGIYPLKGKLMNVRDASIKKIADNNEINDIKKIMGLELNKKYKDKKDIESNLRYGKIMLLCDSDVDGHHIKGLCINMFHSLWGELVKHDNFITYMNTPILKARKGQTELNFYNEHEYFNWKKENNTKGWTIKYYKGLGTSTAREFKEYFKEKKVVSFNYDEELCDEDIDKVFNKNRSQDRKMWLENYEKDSRLDVKDESISYSDFINKELIHFSKYDCERSIPNMMDGLKTSLRKILYSALKRNLVKEIKVAQFGGYVSEHSGYHHGENSLMKAIVGMAQDFVGSNNINLLVPIGQFGSRYQGGEDSASERYIYTQLQKITSYIYRKEDVPVLDYLNDDGELVEPEFYTPIIPMILVNGSKGIGTGFSTSILSYNPEQIIKYLIQKLKGNDVLQEIEPYYEGYKGSIIKVEEHKYLFKGVYERKGVDEIEITELPIGVWTDDYKLYLERLMDDTREKNGKNTPIIKEYKDMSTDVNVDLIIKFNKGIVDKLEAQQVNTHYNGLEKALNLITTKTTSNMHLFDSKQKLKKYDTIYDIIEDYYSIRMIYYDKRKQYQLEQYEREIKLLSNKAKFIMEQCNDELDLRRKKRDEVIKLLEERGYDKLENDVDYKYLRNMPIDSVIEENITKLLNEKGEKEKEYDKLYTSSTNTIWLNELLELEEEYKVYKRERENKQNNISTVKENKSKTKRKLKLKK